MNRAAVLTAAMMVAWGLLAVAPRTLAEEVAVAPPSSPTPGLSAGAAIPLHAAVAPARPDPQVGELLVYRGWIAVDPWIGVRWSAPDREGDLAWGPVRTGRARLARRLGRGIPWPADSVWVEAPLQLFALGAMALPGLGFQLESGSDVVRTGRLPLVRVRVRSMLAAGDSGASLRPARGPLSAPWWERVPWRMVIAVAVVVAAAVLLVLRMRRRKVVPPLVAASAAKRRDPGAEALAEWAALRRLGLPAQGRFAEHAFMLGRILRRYLEATVHVPRPGDTTPELVRHLESAGITGEELHRLGGLLRRWDGIKFARLESDVEEAERCEDSVREMLVGRARATRQEPA